MENELLVLNAEEVYESENLNYDELEELLEQQFTTEFSNLEKSMSSNFNLSLSLNLKRKRRAPSFI